MSEEKFLKSTVNGIVLAHTVNLASLDYMVPCDEGGNELYKAVAEDSEIKARKFEPIVLAPEEPETPEEPAGEEFVPIGEPKAPEEAPKKALEDMSRDEIKELAAIELDPDFDLRLSTDKIVAALKEALASEE